MPNYNDRAAERARIEAIAGFPIPDEPEGGFDLPVEVPVEHQDWFTFNQIPLTFINVPNSRSQRRRLIMCDVKLDLTNDGRPKFACADEVGKNFEVSFEFEVDREEKEDIVKGLCCCFVLINPTKRRFMNGEERLVVRDADYDADNIIVRPNFSTLHS